jgi:hypothetical protein
VTLKEWLDIATTVVAVIGLPFAIAVFLYQQRKERERVLVIFDLPNSLLERACLVAYEQDMHVTERRRGARRHVYPHVLDLTQGALHG